MLSICPAPFSLNPSLLFTCPLNVWYVTLVLSPARYARGDGRRGGTSGTSSRYLATPCFPFTQCFPPCFEIEMWFSESLIHLPLGHLSFLYYCMSLSPRYARYTRYTRYTRYRRNTRYMRYTIYQVYQVYEEYKVYKVCKRRWQGTCSGGIPLLPHQ